MIISTPTYTTDAEHVVITPATSLELYLEMDLHLKHAQDLLGTPIADFKANLATEKRSQQAIVICGFPAIGKSSFRAANEDGYKGYCVEDLDSSLFSKGPEWPSNYLEAITAKLGERCILTISTHREVFRSLMRDGVDLVLVYPRDELKTEWLQRIRKREIQAQLGPLKEIYDKVDNHWYHWIHEYRQQDGCLNYEMSGGEYLVDAIDNIMEYFELEFHSTGGGQITNQLEMGS